MNPAAVAAVALVDLDRAELQAAMGKHPLALRHGLGGHPLPSRAAFVELASRHPDGLVEHHRGDRA